MARVCRERVCDCNPCKLEKPWQQRMLDLKPSFSSTDDAKPLNPKAMIDDVSSILDFRSESKPEAFEPQASKPELANCSELQKTSGSIRCWESRPCLVEVGTKNQKTCNSDDCAG